MTTIPPNEELAKPISSEELILLLSDLSGTMTELGITGKPRYQEVEQHLYGNDGLMPRMARSIKSDAFWVGDVQFSSTVTARGPKRFAEIADGEFPLEMGRHGGLTAMGDAELVAEQMVATFFANETQGIPRTAVICMFSDGQHNTGADPRPVAERLKQMATTHKYRPGVTIVCAAYGSDAVGR